MLYKLKKIIKKLSPHAFDESCWVIGSYAVEMSCGGEKGVKFLRFFCWKICTVQKVTISLHSQKWNNNCDCKCESSSVGRAQPCHGWGRGFESRLSLKEIFEMMQMRK